MGSVLKPLKNSKYPSLCQLKHPQNDQYAIPAGCRELKTDINTSGRWADV